MGTQRLQPRCHTRHALAHPRHNPCAVVLNLVANSGCGAQGTRYIHPLILTGKYEVSLFINQVPLVQPRVTLRFSLCHSMLQQNRTARLAYSKHLSQCRHGVIAVVDAVARRHNVEAIGRKVIREPLGIARLRAY